MAKKVDTAAEREHVSIIQNLLFLKKRFRRPHYVGAINGSGHAADGQAVTMTFNAP